METGSAQATTEDTPPPIPARKPRRMRRLLTRVVGVGGLIFFGVLLPLGTLVVERALGICAEVYLNPIPTKWHALLIALVGVANATAIWQLRRQALQAPVCTCALLGFGIGTSAVYALFMAPLYPLTCGIILFSAGALFLPAALALLPLSPGLSGAVALSLLYRTARPHRGARRKLTAAAGGGFLAAWLVLFGLEIPTWLARLALSDERAPLIGHSTAVNALRALGDEESILRVAYGEPRALAGLSAWAFSTHRSIFWNPAVSQSFEPERAQQLYFEVTGNAYNRFPRPAGTKPWLAWFRGDLQLGTQSVGEASDEIALASSNLDLSLAPDRGLGYTEWTMVFRNSSEIDREARGLVRLPAGSVVSRATLWVNGVEQEAAFGSATAVTQAYQRVVARRRDPLLVTWAGPDRIFVQCFPVPAHGEMKIRIGLSQPLEPGTGTRMLATLPGFLEQNFSVAESLHHHVWIESSGALSSTRGELAQDSTPQTAAALRGDLTGTVDLSQVIITSLRSSSELDTRSLDTTASPPRIIEQSIGVRSVEGIHRAVLVIDGSASLNGVQGDLAAALKALPSTALLSVILADDEPRLLTGSALVAPTERAFADAVEALRLRRARGGRLNLGALRTALDEADKAQTRAIIWIHGPQPVLSPDADAIRQHLSRRPVPYEIISIPIVDGPDRISEALSAAITIRELRPRAGEGSDLKNLLVGVFTGGEQQQLIRTATLATGAPETVPPVLPHLNRLWAADEVSRMLGTRRTESRQAATELATRYRIVTPVSGAVVLESAAALTAQGLEPSPVASVPVIPEPEFVAIALLASLMLIGAAWRHRRQVVR